LNKFGGFAILLMEITSRVWTCWGYIGVLLSEVLLLTWPVLRWRLGINY